MTSTVIDWILHKASRQTYRAFTGRDISWCGAAYRARPAMWAVLWVKVFGEEHCKRSSERYP